jgi:putative transcriptional regulator
MMTMLDDSQRVLAGAYALGVLEGAERAAFEAHLVTCADCVREVEGERVALGRLGRAWPVAPPAGLKAHVLELAEAPATPIDLTRYDWEEVVPGIRVHVMKDDPERGVRTALVWGKPGARYPSHRHLGDEKILVLEGSLRDQRGTYGPGQVCRSRTGSIHSEEVVGEQDCICFVVYHGGHEPVAE